MSRQRWGTFSVMDHLRPNPFIADVLLYDRLVLPYPPDKSERDRWKKWNPDHLDACLEALGGRAYKVFWDKSQKIVYRKELASARAAMETMRKRGYVEGAGMTRSVLANYIQNQADEWGTRPPLVMTAYPSALLQEGFRYRSKEA